MEQVVPQNSALLCAQIKIVFCAQINFTFFPTDYGFRKRKLKEEPDFFYEPEVIVNYPLLAGSDADANDEDDNQVICDFYSYILIHFLGKGKLNENCLLKGKLLQFGHILTPLPSVMLIYLEFTMKHNTKPFYIPQLNLRTQ